MQSIVVRAPSTRRRTIAAAAAVVPLAIAGLILGGVSVASAAPGVSISASDVTATARPADGGLWLDRADATGSFEVTADSFDSTGAAKLTLPNTSTAVVLHDDYTAANRPTDLPALLAGASYTYTGTNVNFEVEVVFHAADAQYSATGSSPCTSAAAWQIPGADAGSCYALFKWEPFATASTWSTVDLSAGTAGNSSTTPQTGGWLSQKQVGSIPATPARVGHPLTDYLGQMSDYQVVSFGFGAGSGAAAPTAGWVKNVTFGGTSYSFAPEVVTPPTPPAPAPAATPPAASDDALEQLIATQGIDVAATTDTFSVNGGAPGTGLDALDPSKPISGELPWAGQGDSYVDVYGYSSPIYLGTFPVVNGKVVLTGLDISALEAGGHHLVFLGQTSGALSVVAIAVDTLAATGANAMPYLVSGGVLLLLGVVALLVVTIRRRRTSN